jgi:hypothetical protein
LKIIEKETNDSWLITFKNEELALKVLDFFQTQKINVD